MDLNDIEKNIILLSLSNLIEEYYNALEDNQLNPEGREFMITVIHKSQGLIKKISKALENPETHKISRPKWKEP